MQVQISGISHKGKKRKHNEDNFVICKDLSIGEWSYEEGETRELSEKGTLKAVADGVGGSAAGEVASHIAVESIKAFFSSHKSFPTTTPERENLLRVAIIEAHDQILNEQEKRPETAGMGTTLVVGWVVDGLLHVAWAGDSRCYIHHDGAQLLPFTNDHSLVWDSVRKGEMPPEEARLHPHSPIITQSLGNEQRPPHPETKTAVLFRGDQVMLCSDGLNGMMSDQSIRTIMEQNEGAKDTSRNLLNQALSLGGDDNITITLMEIIDGPPPDEEILEKRNYLYEDIEG